MLQGIDTYWETLSGKITLLELLEHTTAEEIVEPEIFESLLPDVHRNTDRIEAADLSYPIIVSVHKGEPKLVVDGQHRVVKAIKYGEMIRVRYLDIKDIFY